MLTDAAIGFLPLNHDPQELPAAVVVHDRVLLAALSELFERWERAVPISVPPAVTPVRPTGSCSRCWSPA